MAPCENRMHCDLMGVMKQAVFFDIDGTLAVRRDIPQSAVESIRILRSRDIGVFICTGRNASYVRQHFSAYADGVICANGRYAYFKDQVLYDHPIETSVLESICRIVTSRNCGIIFFGNTHAYYQGEPKGYDQFVKEHAGGSIDWLEELPVPDPIYTLDVFFHSEAQLHLLEQDLQNICLLNPHLPHPTADITIHGHDKGTALRAVSRRLGIPEDQTYAFGDGMNDLCMFQAAGHGIAMGNAVPELKEAAEYVTSEIMQDGVMRGLQHFGLIP